MGIAKWIKSIGKNTLYYPGCLTKFVLEKEFRNYKKILTALGVDYIIIGEEVCCGMPVINAGYEKDARQLAKKNFEIFNKYGVKKIITSCPSCYSMLSKYKELVPGWDIEVEHITITILHKLKKARITSIANEEITYHDPCHLGRYSGIYEEPRQILRELGYTIKEMRHTKENSLCCGGGAGLRNNEPNLSKKIAQERIQQARDLGVKKIITPCPLCFSHMKENSDLEVLEFSYVVGQALGLDVEKTQLEKTALEKEACS